MVTNRLEAVFQDIDGFAENDGVVIARRQPGGTGASRSAGAAGQLCISRRTNQGVYVVVIDTVGSHSAPGAGPMAG